VRFALMIEPQQGLSYVEQLEIARRAEHAGFETLFRSDHYQSFPGPLGLPTTDAWTVIAGLARDTELIRLGVLVSPVTFRHPGQLAKIVTTVDEMSGGRVELGVGAGWHEDEHRQLGLPFPAIEERVDMLEEELEILRGLWTAPDGWNHAGRHFTVEGARFHPKPVQRPHPPIIVGGKGSPRAIRIAARLADEFNFVGGEPGDARKAFKRLEAAARNADRDPASIVCSAMAGVVVGRDAAESRQRLDALVGAVGPEAADGTWLDERRPRWILGTPDQARARVREYAEAGAQRIVLQDFLPRDLEMIDLLGAELVRAM
jgi:F420-dependent oxidoreductase-like protein